MSDVVVDASAVVDILIRNHVGLLVAGRLSGESIHAPAHLDAEVLFCLRSVGSFGRSGSTTTWSSGSSGS